MTEKEELAYWKEERKLALSQLRELCEEFGDNDWDETLHLADIIEKHLGDHLYFKQLQDNEYESMNGWISIKDRMPEEGEKVLVWTVSDEYAIGYLTESRDFLHSVGIHLKTYTQWIINGRLACEGVKPLYWMPLPNKPEDV